jgi:hypothetical protein
VSSRPAAGCWAQEVQDLLRVVLPHTPALRQNENCWFQVLPCWPNGNYTNIQHPTVDRGLWTVDPGLRTPDSGLRTQLHFTLYR